jgi:hypothetical protein
MIWIRKVNEPSSQSRNKPKHPNKGGKQDLASIGETLIINSYLLPQNEFVINYEFWTYLTNEKLHETRLMRYQE